MAGPGPIAAGWGGRRVDHPAAGYERSAPVAGRPLPVGPPRGAIHESVPRAGGGRAVGGMTGRTAAAARNGALPAHLGIIMDGNGRWAMARGLPRISGHEEGARSVKEVVRSCREIGVGALTLYSFSSENWRRPVEEVAALMMLLARYLGEERAEILENDIRLVASGEVERLPDFVRGPLDELIAVSAGNGGMVLNLALSYGSRRELVRAARRVSERVLRGELSPEEVDEEAFAAELYTAGLPDPDLVLRTGGEMRLSNFLLWQAAYAEIFVTEVMWPEFRRPHLMEALREFERRQRRFGRTPEQVVAAGGSE